MDVQTALNFEIAGERETALRNALEPLRLPDWSAELICLLVRDGRQREVSGHRCYEVAISKRKAAKKLGCSPNTFAAAAADLQRRGVLEIVAFGQRRTYFLSADRVNELAPIADDPIDELGLFADRPTPAETPNRSALVSTGQRARAREDKNYKSRDVNRDRDPCAQGPSDQQVTSPGTRLIDMSDDEVRRRNLKSLRPYFDDAVAQGWLVDEIEDKRKFLAAVHHSGECKGVRQPARVVYAAIKNYDFSRINQDSWDWAAQVLRPKDLQTADSR